MRAEDQDDDLGYGGDDSDDPEEPADFKGLDGSAVSSRPRRSIDSSEQEGDEEEPGYSFDDEDEFENFIHRTYVCEDCDFRWAEKIFPDRNDFPDYDDEMGHAHLCPMCGSTNVSFY